MYPACGVVRPLNQHTDAALTCHGLSSITLQTFYRCTGREISGTQNRKTGHHTVGGRCGHPAGHLRCPQGHAGPHGTRLAPASGNRCEGPPARKRFRALTEYCHFCEKCARAQRAAARCGAPEGRSTAPTGAHCICAACRRVRMGSHNWISGASTEHAPASCQKTQKRSPPPLTAP